MSAKILNINKRQMNNYGVLNMTQEGKLDYLQLLPIRNIISVTQSKNEIRLTGSRE